MDAPQSPQRPPDLGPRYRAVRLIARGGMGVVWEAHDLERDKPCAVKILGPGPGRISPEFVLRFEREAVLAERLAGHEGLVAAHASGTTGAGQPFLVMELVRGETLEDLIDRDLSRADAVRHVRDVARAVSFAHARGVVHRDLKPSNVIVDESGRARLLDYGVAKLGDGAGSALTATGDRLGSPCYMAPEQIDDSKRVDARTDVYGLGAVLYQALVKEPPYDGATVMGIMTKVMEGQLVRPRAKDPTVDAELDAICARALSKDPAARQHSAEALAAELEAWLGRSGDPNVGRVVVKKYELLERLGAGGMGSVYRARQTLDDREVALKLVHGDLLRESAARARFLREVAAAQSFVHKHAVVVRDYGEDTDGTLYLTMDLVRGQTLGARGRERGGRLPAAEVLALGKQALDALGEAHAAGFVHRDLKPENVMVEDGPKGLSARILDFGIAKAIAKEKKDDVTDEGKLVGTPRYMSPEQAAGDAVDGRSDLWSLAAVMYEALAGRPVHEADSSQKLLWKLSTVDPTPLERVAPDVPLSVCRAVMLALRRERAQRPADAATWRRALEEAERSLSTRSTGSGRLPPAIGKSEPQVGSSTRAASKDAPFDRLLGGPAPAASSGGGGRGVVLLIIAVVGVVIGIVVGSTWTMEDEDPYAAQITQSVVTTGIGDLVADRTPPTIDLRDPEEGLETELPFVEVAAIVSDARLGEVRVNGVLVAPTDRRGVAWITTTLSIPEGATTIEVIARDTVGNESRAQRTVTRLAPPPEPVPTLPRGFVAGPDPRTAINEKDGSVLVWLPPGSFRMGSGVTDARPRHDVRLSRGAWIGRTEVTWAQFRRFCEATNRAPPKAELSPDGFVRFVPGPEHPVFNVTWSDAKDYLAWAGLRLPTEAEWEYAASGGRGVRFPWGDRTPVFGEQLANAATPLDLGLPGQDDGTPFTAAVGSFPAGASPFGALDLAGNVDEWVEDWFGAYPSRAQTDPRGPSSGTRRVYRGGSWASALRECGVSGRASANPEYANAHLGFRVAR